MKKRTTAFGRKNSVIFWKIISLVFLTLFVVTWAFPGVIRPKPKAVILISNKNSKNAIIQTVYASEIYPMFSCPCCGQPLDKIEPCCGSMEQMIKFIDEKVADGLDKAGLVLATVKEFGLARLISEEDRNAIKQKLIDLAPKDAPKIEINELSRDLGDVSQKNGVVRSDFEFKNVGKSDLVINKLSSSCGCTSASVVYKGVEGPRFAMEGHGQENPKDWEVSIKPNDRALLRVYYDPSVHIDLEGAVTRTVSIMSNDPVEFETEVEITLNQTK